MNSLERWLTYLSPETTEEERVKLAEEDPIFVTVMKAELEFFSDPKHVADYLESENRTRKERGMSDYERKLALERDWHGIVCYLINRGLSPEEIALRFNKSVAEIKMILECEHSQHDAPRANSKPPLSGSSTVESDGFACTDIQTVNP